MRPFFYKVIIAVGALMMFAGCRTPKQHTMQRRWFYVSSNLKDAAQVDTIRGLVQRARIAGLTGMVLDAGFDTITLQPPVYFSNLDTVRHVCQAAGIEIIPLMFSAGYGNQLLQHDKNLAAALPVKNVLFKVLGDTCMHIPSTQALFTNGHFERREGDRFKGFWFHDRPRRVSFADTVVKHSGKAAIRFENFKKSYKGHARVMQEVEVVPYRNYVITCYIKTEQVRPQGSVRILVLTRAQRELAPRQLRIPATTQGWMKVELPFNSEGNHKVRIYVGGWKTSQGRFWLDDLSIRETALTGIVQRAGTPLTVRSRRTGEIFSRGTDYTLETTAALQINFDRPGPLLLRTQGSTIPDGDTLQVSYYHYLPVRFKQLSVCLSEEKIYDIWKAQVHKVHEVLAPQTYFLSMDEIRAGGTCKLCRDRNVSLADILGDCVARQYALIRSVNIDADMWMWSDMFDPGHNAIKNYYLTRGDLDGVWKRIPQEIGMMCWINGKRRKNLRHFSQAGFRTMGACFYDVNDDANMVQWRALLDKTAGAQGMMYTTWQHDYTLLERFGEITAADTTLIE